MVIVQSIFKLFADGMGITAIVRYLNENSIPTPIQYARFKGLTGNYDDGNGSWNSRSVKYIFDKSHLSRCSLSGQGNTGRSWNTLALG